jgi:hypothetical protein
VESTPEHKRGPESHTAPVILGLEPRTFLSRNAIMAALEEDPRVKPEDDIAQ